MSNIDRRRESLFYNRFHFITMWQIEISKRSWEVIYGVGKIRTQGEFGEKLWKFGDWVVKACSKGESGEIGREVVNWKVEVMSY